MFNSNWLSSEMQHRQHELLQAAENRRLVRQSKLIESGSNKRKLSVSKVMSIIRPRVRERYPDSAPRLALKSR
jgi:hypothetical protein